MAKKNNCYKCRHVHCPGGSANSDTCGQGGGGQNWAKICGRPVWMTPFTHTVKCKAINFIFWDFKGVRGLPDTLTSRLCLPNVVMFEQLSNTEKA